MSQDIYNNGGQWLNAVFHTGPSYSLIGFVHAEDQYWDGANFNGNGKAYKSIELGDMGLF